MAFNVIFTWESAMLAFANCFIFGTCPYLSDGWNKLDFFVVVFAWLEFIPGFNSLSFLRSLRVVKVSLENRADGHCEGCHQCKVSIGLLPFHGHNRLHARHDYTTRAERCMLFCSGDSTVMARLSATPER